MSICWPCPVRPRCTKAAGIGAVYGGATVASWYPITPSTSLVEGYEKYAEKYRVDKETGKKNFAIVQAEDELAALGMAIGANWNGARSFTATSGPGLSLMNEFLGLAYFSEIPVVLVDVQRSGPSTGMPTRTQQSDLLMAAYASHGDTKHVFLIPSLPVFVILLPNQRYLPSFQNILPVWMELKYHVIRALCLRFYATLSSRHVG